MASVLMHGDNAWVIIYLSNKNIFLKIERGNLGSKWMFAELVKIEKNSKNLNLNSIDNY